ncbi:MAG: hypothetical protein MUD00_03520 [Candidatus Pacebacteria bacterium]|jgi:hypothetical protein|nr:hypothetical protein [Candidatus Paceibacterota bacterium]
MSDLIEKVFFIFTNVIPYFLPFVLAYIAWKSWMEYINTQYLRSIKWKMLQIVLPKEVVKTPEAMEVVFSTAFHQTGGTGTWWAKYVQGKLRPYFSLEIASLEGNVFFFIRTPEFFKNLIESQIYAQYPQIEIIETDDYVDSAPQDPIKEGWHLWGVEYKLGKDDVYPIKTYVDFGLDKPPMPAFPGMASPPSSQLDPITGLVEHFGSIKKGEHLWMQFVIRAAWDSYQEPDSWFGKRSWTKEAAARVKQIKEDMKGKTEEGMPPKMLSKGEQDVVSALERSISKYGFDVGIRALYMADTRVFTPINIISLVNVFKQYGSEHLNSLKVANVTDYDYPWQDPWQRREHRNIRSHLQAYRERRFFYPPWSDSFSMHNTKHTTFILNTEELATLYHFPGRVSETATFKRIDSKKGEPPQNLPI